MESQELKMLEFISRLENREFAFSEHFKKMREEFRDTSYGCILINNLNKKGYVYVVSNEKGINFGNTRSMLTDKGNKYLRGNTITRWCIENLNSVIVTSVLTMILTCIINGDKIIQFLDRIFH